MHLQRQIFEMQLILVRCVMIQIKHKITALVFGGVIRKLLATVSKVFQK